METQRTVGQPTNDDKTELISIYPENFKEILTILRDLNIGFELIGKDQSNRLLFKITYDDSQTQNILAIRDGIQELERGNQIANMIIAGIRMFLPKSNY